MLEASYSFLKFQIQKNSFKLLKKYPYETNWICIISELVDCASLC